MSFTPNPVEGCYTGNSFKDLSGSSTISGTFTTPSGRTDITPSVTHSGIIGRHDTFGAGVDVHHRPNQATTFHGGAYTHGGSHGVRGGVTFRF